jgi:23S rRNA (uracil1939-C5)-methyltransferase
MKEKNKKGDSLELLIEDLAFGARGVARKDDFVWFINRGIPGQKVRAIVRRIRSNYGEADIVEVIEPSPHQTNPPCPYFGTCGGCQLQHLKYEIQVEYKTRQVNEILKRIGGLDKLEVCPTIPAEQTYGYRNKMEFTFSDRRWTMETERSDMPSNFALGLHVRRRFDRVIHIDACMLQSEISNRVFKTASDLTLETGLNAYNIKNHTGFWRFLVIREGKNTSDLMLNFITSGQESEKGTKALDWIVHKLFWRHPEVTTVIHSTTDRKAQVAVGESERLILGTGKITEQLGGKLFEISPDSFFQTNTSQAEVLFETIAKIANFKGDETVYDLYCGTGAIGISIADKVKQVICIEVIESAVKNGIRNMELNNISNLTFINADIKDILKKKTVLQNKYAPPDIIILDPPRGGTHPDIVKHITALLPQKIVYISCNPSILARDLKVLCEKSYRLSVVQPIDMFPHTGHIEVVALLHRNSLD